MSTELKHEIEKLGTLHSSAREFARINVLTEQHIKRAKYFTYGSIAAGWALFLHSFTPVVDIREPATATVYFVSLIGITYFGHRKLQSYSAELWSNWSNRWRKRLEKCDTEEESKRVQDDFMREVKAFSSVVPN